MATDVFTKTRELADAVLKSKEYEYMMSCEKAVVEDDEASLRMGAYVQQKSILEALIDTERPNHVAIAKASRELDELKQELEELALVKEMLAARDTFSGMLTQVNDLLRFCIFGEMEQVPSSSGGGCSGGGCASCAGGCGRS